MIAIDRVKRKVVSRLTGEPDITYFESSMDKKVAKLTFKDREILVQERKGGDIMFLRKSKEYVYAQEYFAGHTKEGAIGIAKGMIKDDEIWRR